MDAACLTSPDEFPPPTGKGPTRKSATVSGSEGGIGKIKRVLNHLHTETMHNDYSEGYAHQENDVRAFLYLQYLASSVFFGFQCIVLHRVQPITQKATFCLHARRLRNGRKTEGGVGILPIV